MIDRERKILFLHIPKTGGGFVESLLLGSDEVGDHRRLDAEILSTGSLARYFPLRRHATLREYEDLLRAEGERVEDYRVFALVRDPRDVLRSTYRFRVRNFALRRHGMSAYRRRRFRLEHLAFTQFLLLQVLRCWLGRRQLRDASVFLESASGVEVRVFRLEDVARDARELLEYLGLPVQSVLPHKNPTATAGSRDSILSTWAARIIHPTMTALHARSSPRV